MNIVVKNRSEILSKLRIKRLNSLQEEVLKVFNVSEDILILSPTGTGKTLAYLLPILESLNPNCKYIQALVVVPSRELAIQIEQVFRTMGTGYKAIAIYGGRSGKKDTIDLQHPPALLIGTPGRIADHIERESFSVQNISMLVLDEFDKSLEIGFEYEMKSIIWELPHIDKKILTSATHLDNIPEFVGFRDPFIINHLHQNKPEISIKVINTQKSEKLTALIDLVQKLRNQKGVIFCNFKESISSVSEYLSNENISHEVFYGGLEQKDRERALIKFRNGSNNLLLATDLAARGIDIDDINFIIHLELPLKEQEFIHRNGRTARMNEKGVVYILHSEELYLPDFIPSNYISLEEIKVENSESKNFTTLFISGGRRDKISKGDIVGLFLKEGKLSQDDLGLIELKQDCAFVAVAQAKAEKLAKLLNNSKLKKKKVRIKVLE
ncbi:DEAD/DEAH box helicase [Marivirga arenosa]|uniref:DEAD/DEAH box helicase n=1 Tax=Marivirga arenosa TaxID=3059076 RepID=A0AA51ZVH0_9BACT|nr:DEAD/DEAH box helicase [Marivirga sp. BKB1-2]WNB17486.1 DEAD/DEAH box helicase [Marivirga sp. BKB1-2]